LWIVSYSACAKRRRLGRLEKVLGEANAAAMEKRYMIDLRTTCGADRGPLIA
jgi:hypothetical protein